MKLKRYLIAGTIVLASALEASAQDVQKPRMQTSASPNETVYKPKTESTGTSKEKSQKQLAVTSQDNSASAPKSKSAAAANRFVAVKANIAYLAIAVPSVAVEVACGKHFSVELPVSGSFWDLKREKAIRTVLLQPELRWWMKETGKGHFFGVHAHIGWFNVKWNDDRYQNVDRPLLGAGVSYGYSLPLSAHWGAEFTLGAGYANMKYNTYYNVDNGARISTDSRNYWGITRVGASLVYRF